MLDVELPNLCGFFDKFVYPNENVTKLLNNSAYFIDLPMQLFLQKLKISPEKLDEFKSEILKYSKRNLIKITAYIEKVFAAQYITDQVNLVKTDRPHKSIIILFHKYFLMLLSRFKQNQIVTMCPQMMTLNTLIANLGGMLGLCMGFSLVTLMEILYFLFSATSATIRK